MTKPVVAAANKKLVIDEKMFKKIESLVNAYNDALKAQKKAAKGGPAPLPVDPAKSVAELGALVAKSWAKIKEVSGIKDPVPVAKKADPKKPAAKKPAAKKPAAKKPAAKKPAVAKKPVTPKPLLKPKA